MEFMFNICYNLKKIEGIEKFNTNNVTNMNSMFQECANLEKLILSNFNTINVTDMGMMFNKCNQIKEIIGIKNFDTFNVTNMYLMFN